jgi:hypothetical protein
MFTGKALVDMSRSGAGYIEAFEGSLWLFLILWLAVSILLWVLTRVLPKTAL